MVEGSKEWLWVGSGWSDNDTTNVLRTNYLRRAASLKLVRTFEYKRWREVR